MNRENALNLLGIINEDYDTSELKRQYRMCALMYHPDKNNNSIDASNRFLEIKEAYDLLLKSSEEEGEVEGEGEEGENNDVLSRILKEYLGVQIVDNYKINEVLDKLLSVCEKQSISILEKINDRKFEIMYSILKKYRHVFFLSEQFYEQMEQIKERKKTENNEIIELYPTINELMQHMVYKLYRKDELYLVPLWHHELVYEDKVTGDEFVVRCYPPNEKDIHIDEYNNLHCNKEYNIEYIFDKSVKKEQIEVKIGDYKSVFINPWELNITPITQTIRWKKEGISIPNTDIHNISNKADIFLHITLNANPTKIYI
jgi:hypothetical protein